MKYIYRIFVLMGLAFLPSFVLAAPGFSGLGSGTDVDPYQISSCSDLDNVRYGLSSHFILTQDLDCAGEYEEEAGIFYNRGQGFRK